MVDDQDYLAEMASKRHQEWIEQKAYECVARETKKSLNRPSRNASKMPSYSDILKGLGIDVVA